MSTVTIDGPTRDRLLAAGGTVELVDEAGNPVGKAVVYIRSGNYFVDDWPSDEEIDRRLREGKRYSVAEVNERIRQLREAHG